MANPEHEAILRQGVEVWNQWRKDNPTIIPDLIDADLANLNLYGIHFAACTLTRANLSGSNLSSGYLHSSNFVEADLSNANIVGTRLTRANFTRAKLLNTNLGQCVLTRTDFTEANLTGARLVETMMIMTNFENAILEDCDVFGISAWDLKLNGANQKNLKITRWDEPLVSVDNIEVAQFVYLLLNNAKLRDVIVTLTTKSVLILGRFTPERKAVLDAIRVELRKHDYVPILFDFDKPANRNFSETVMTLASLSRFIIIDLSDPNSSPYEALLVSERLRSVPLQGIFCPTPGHLNPFPMYADLQSSLSHVLPIYRYETEDGLMAALEEKVIKPAEDKVEAMRPPKNPVL